MKQVKNKIKNYINEELSKRMKDLTIKKVFVFSVILLIIVFEIILFMNFTLMITYDGSNYHTYLEYFKGKSLSSWDNVRGFGFPLILFIITKLFGDNIKGVLWGFLIFYLGMLFCTYKIIKFLIKDNNLTERQLSYWGLFIILFLFNPLILSYSHMMLTEAIIPFFYILTIFICLKWFDINYKNNKKEFIIYAFIMSFLSAFIWQIKQPYIFAYWTMIGLTAILSGISQKKFKEFFQKFIVLCCCIMFTFLSVFIFNKMITNAYQKEIKAIENKESISENEDKPKDKGNTMKMVTNFLINGIRYNYKTVYQNKYCDEEYFDNVVINEKLKNDLKNLMTEDKDWCDHILVYDVYDLNKEYLETEVLIHEGDKLKFMESLNFYLHLLSTHPLLVLNSYYQNFLGLLNFTYVSPKYLIPDGTVQPYIRNENVYGIFQHSVYNYWWHDVEIKEFELKQGYILPQYEDEITKLNIVSSLMLILSQFTDVTFSFLLYLSLPIFIYGLIMLIKHKQNKSYLLITILSGASFANVFFYSFTGAIIDRYAYPVYPLMLLCVIIMFMDKSKKYELITEKKIKNQK